MPGRVAIIIPTRKRSAFLLERFRVLERNTVEIFNGIGNVHVAMDEDDPDTHKVVKDNFPIFQIHQFPPLSLPCDKWNLVAKSLPDAKWFVTLSDDSIPHPNWLTIALNTINKGFIGLPDGVTGNRNESFTPLYMATRTWLKEYNGGVLVIPHYKSWYADMETAIRAQKSNTYFVSTHSIVEQLHVVFSTAPADDIYKLGASRRIDDFKMYLRRVRRGFPNDFEAVL